MATPSWLQRLQTRWGISSPGQTLVILLVFALTGFSAVYVRRPIFAWLGLGPATPWYVKTGWWLITVLPAYQVLLLGWGFLLGQFSFFWEFEKRTFGRLFGYRPPRSRDSAERQP